MNHKMALIKYPECGNDVSDKANKKYNIDFLYFAIWNSDNILNCLIKFQLPVQIWRIIPKNYVKYLLLHLPIT